MIGTTLLAALVENIIQDPVFIIDNKGKLVFANNEAKLAIRESKFREKLYLNKLWESLALHIVFEEEDTTPLQLRKVTIAGKCYSVNAILQDNDLVLTLRDISDLRNMAAAYSRYAELYSNMSHALHHLHQGILITDPWGEVLYGNEVAAGYLHIDTPSRLSGQRSNLLSPVFVEFDDEQEEVRIVERADLVSRKENVAPGPLFLQIRGIPLFYLGKNRGKVFLMEPFHPPKTSGKTAEATDTLSFSMSKTASSLKQTKENSPQYTLADFVGQSKSVLKLKELVRKVARTSSTVLIQSESGTGKELLAHALHSHSARAEKPFVKLNCSSIPETLLESEIFGYEPGAFTGARKSGYAGRFEQADGGTIFLDEIGEMQLSLQVKLLRVIQEREVQRLGGLTTHKLDVRIICATNISLHSHMEQNLFRSDLYHRLNVVTLNIPPLRERKEDIKSFVIYFLRKNSQLFHKNVKGISQNVYTAFMDYDWPGNVRELGNVIEYAFNVVDGDIIEIEHLPDYLVLLEGKLPQENSKLDTLLGEYSAKVAWNVLDRHGGNKVEAARELGISRATLYRILRGNKNRKGAIRQ